MSIADAQTVIFQARGWKWEGGDWRTAASIAGRIGRSIAVDLPAAYLGAAIRRRQERKAISHLHFLDDHLLKDIGVYRRQIATKVRGPEAGRRREGKATTHTFPSRGRRKIGLIPLLLVAGLLSGCAKGTWDARNGIFTLPFGAASAPRVTGRTTTALAIPPALGRGRGIIVQEAQIFPTTDLSQ